MSRHMTSMNSVRWSTMENYRMPKQFLHFWHIKIFWIRRKTHKLKKSVCGACVKKEGCLFLPVFFVGVFLANLLKYKAGDLCRILNIWILEQFAYSSISPERLFWQLLWKRGKFAFFFFLFGEGLSLIHIWGIMMLCLIRSGLKRLRKI